MDRSCLWMADSGLLLMTLLAFRRNCSPASSRSCTGTPKLFGSSSTEPGPRHCPQTLGNPHRPSTKEINTVQG
jgi:hypothetical protein